MAEESDLEKTESASPRRLEKAREDGQVARSRELGTFALLAAGGACIWLLGGDFYRSLSSIIDRSMSFDQRIVADPGMMVAHAVQMAGEALWMLAPLFVLLVVIAVFSSVALGGLVFSAKAMAPKWSKLSFFAGIKRIFSMQTLAELFKAMAKAALVGSVGGYIVWAHHAEMLSLMYAAPQEAFARMSAVIALCCMIIIGSLIVIVILDVPWQIWQHLKKLRMSKEDVKNEHKESEGDPHTKARIRQQQRAVSRRRMMNDVPRADVIVTNPTHYAVALTYAENGSGAPRVVAKGMGQIALRIRALGHEHRVPILEAPPLARALHKHVEIGHEIPTALYGAVAEVLAWVFQLRAWRPGAGPHPYAPDEVTVPAGMDPLAPGLTTEASI